LVFDFERRSDQHRCVEPSPGRLFDHPVDQRLLSGLEQLNALEAIPQRLQNRAQDVQNIWRRDGREETAHRSTSMLVAVRRLEKERAPPRGTQHEMRPPVHFGSLADIRRLLGDVRFTPTANKERLCDEMID